MPGVSTLPLLEGQGESWCLTLRSLEAATLMSLPPWRHSKTTTKEALMSTTTDLHGIVAGHVTAVNAQDEDAIVATFADDAFVNDAHREFWGADAIRRWVAKEIV